MFKYMAKDINVFALTAANDRESSWGYYCGSEAVVRGKNLRTCLSDEFSAKWMESLDAKGTDRTIDSHATEVREKTRKSHVTRYGDEKLTQHKVSHYLGKISPSGKDTNYDDSKYLRVSSRDMELFTRSMIYKELKDKESFMSLKEEVISRRDYDFVFNKISSEFDIQMELEETTDYDCYSGLLERFEASCEIFSDYGLKYGNILYNLCYSKPEEAENVKVMIDTLCEDRF